MAKSDYEMLLEQLEAALLLKVRKDWEFTSNGQKFILSLRPVK